MLDELFKWGLGVLTSAGIMGFIGYVMRDALVKFLTKSVEHKFEKKLETFKADIRDSEKELEQIRSFLVSSRRDRDLALQAKRFEAAEAMLRARNMLAEFSMLVLYMKRLNVDELLKRGDDPKAIEFINILIKPFNIEEKLRAYGELDKVKFNLYISDNTLKQFNAYETIMINVAMTMKMLSMPLKDKDSFLNKNTISKPVIEAAPLSKDGFEKYGDEYALHWTDYFHAEILKALRKELHGAGNMDKDTESATRLALDSRNAQLKLYSAMNETGLSKTFLKPTERESGKVS
ncbi:hypothetical protein ABVM38_15775 [Klebsiella pneumoniae]|nr:hypothetical protein [Klebsiella pneumoniae]